MACETSNNDIVALLLEKGANPNVLNKWYNHTGVTTMHIAASLGNKAVMQLLIKHGFNLDKLIDKRTKGDKYRNMNVFLILCMNGHVRCLSYLLHVCNDIDLRARTQLGLNGLHLAVEHQHLDMVTFLLQNVYQNTNIRQKMLEERAIKIDSDMSVGEMAFQNLNSGSSQALSILRILMKYGCDFDDLASPRTDNVVKILSSVCIEKDFFEYFGLFKSLLSMYLEYDKISNLEEFYTSSVITQDVVENILMKITDVKYGDSIQYEWIYVITTMLNTYIDPNLAMRMEPPIANGYDEEDSNWNSYNSPNSNSNSNSNSYLYAENVVCSNNHEMIRYNLKSKNVLCIDCGQLRNKFHFACCKCSEYICEYCATALSQRRSNRFGVSKATSKSLLSYLKESKFKEFVRLAKEYPNPKRIILDVCVI